MNKLILVILDGLGYAQSRRLLGNIEGWVANGDARVWKMRAVLPTTSGPCYASIHTGVEPQNHGVLTNDHLHRVEFEDIFSGCRSAGLGTAAVAHSYFSTYFQRTPYDLVRDMEVDDESMPIQHARFYSMQGESSGNLAVPSDYDLFAQTTMLAERFAPHYILSHISSTDSVGHHYGQQSYEMDKNTYIVDGALATFLPRWRENGYDVIVTADHGQSDRGHHGGSALEMREVPLYYFGSAQGAEPDVELDQLQIAPTVLSRLGAPVPESMRAKSFLN
ncbi:MAG: alkaline phosphatase family protein [Pseudomonadota bacterium]